jgi:adenylate cyclase
MLVEFPSVVEAVRCGAELQRAMIDRETSVPEDRRIQFRIGAVSEDNATVFGKPS